MKNVVDMRDWTRSSIMPCCGSNAAPCVEKFMEPRLCNVAGKSIYALHSSHQHRSLGNALKSALSNTRLLQLGLFVCQSTPYVS